MEHLNSIPSPPTSKLQALAKYAGKAIIAAAVPILTTLVADVADMAGEWVIAVIASLASGAGVYAFKNGPKPQ